VPAPAAPLHVGGLKIATPQQIRIVRDEEKNSSRFQYIVDDSTMEMVRLPNDKEFYVFKQ